MVLLSVGEYQTKRFAGSSTDAATPNQRFLDFLCGEMKAAGIGSSFKGTDKLMLDQSHRELPPPRYGEASSGQQGSGNYGHRPGAQGADAGHEGYFGTQGWAERY